MLMLLDCAWDNGPLVEWILFGELGLLGDIRFLECMECILSAE